MGLFVVVLTGLFVATWNIAVSLGHLIMFVVETLAGSGRLTGKATRSIVTRKTTKAAA